MGALSDFVENLLIDGLLRGAALTTGGAAGSSAVVKGIWTATTAYSLGDIVVPHANMTGAGGKFLRCTTAGTSGSTNSLAVPNPGATLVDASVTWTAVAGIPGLVNTYMALFTSSKGSRANTTAYSTNDTIVLLANDGKQHFYKCTTGGTTAGAQSTLYPGAAGEAITDGTAVFTEQSAGMDAGTAITEVSGGSYARVAVASTLANWAGTQSSASTTASTGTGGTTSNNNSISFAAPTANWMPVGGQVVGMALYDALTGGNLINWGLLTTPKSINNGDAAPSFAAAAFTFQIDN